MEFGNLPPAVKLALGLVGVFIVYQLFTQLNLSRKRRALAREKGCLPAPAYPQWEKIVGWDLFRQNIRAFRSKNFLEVSYKRFQEMGVNTYQFVALGSRMYTTIEPENLKTIQAVEFKKWGLGKRRMEGFRPLLGDGECSQFKLL